MKTDHSDRQFQYNEENQTYSANNEPTHPINHENLHNHHGAENIYQGPREQTFFSRIVNSFRRVNIFMGNGRFLRALAFAFLVLAIWIGLKFFNPNSSVATLEGPEISHGSICEKYFDQVKEFLDESFQAKIKSAAEKLDQIEPDIAKHCFPSKKGVNLEIYFKMGFIYFRANMMTRSLIWLDKIENVLLWNQGASLDSETIMKTFLISATSYIQQEEYLQAETALEKAQEAFEDSQKGSDSDVLLYLKSWLKEASGELNLAKYLSSTDRAVKASFYKTAEDFYNEAISLRKSLKKFRIAGSAQCMLTRLYIEAREFEKAEQMNNEGAKNIKRSTEKIYTMASCIKNDALIKLGRGQANTARVRFEEALKLLDEVLPQGNDLIIRYRKEFSMIFSSEL